MAAAGMVSRVLAASVGGYALANAIGALGVLLLPLPLHEAVTWMTIAAFPIHVAVIIGAFAVARISRLWLAISAPTLICLALAAALAR